jgi:SOS-response transcriptional repressor LexA
VVGAIATHLALPNLNEISLQHCDTFEVPSTMVPHEQSPKVVALQVQGTSLLDALVTDGDMVVVQHTAQASRGATVVGTWHEEHTVFLRQYSPNDGTLTLKSLNPQLAPITTTAAEVTIFGVVVGVLRSFKTNNKQPKKR